MKRFIFSTVFCLLLFDTAVNLTHPAYAQGSAPIAENMELTTYKESSVSGALTAYDPETDVVAFEITTKPVKGEIYLEPDGTFVYTPKEGKKGRDYFGYKAIDSEGNISQEATVIIRIEKVKKPIEYKDMKNRASEYAALKLCSKGIFTGEKMGDDYYFFPEKAVTHSEFNAMCKLLRGEKPNIENNSAEITKQEAMLALNAALGLNDVAYIESELEENIEYAQACINLSSVDVIKGETDPGEILTREDAALMLVQAIKILNSR